MFKLSTPGTATRLVVIGAGPIGLEAALRGMKRGWDVTVFEKDQVGSHPLKWSHVRLFTPIKDNVSSLMWETLEKKPDPGSFLTGKEFADLILRPIAKGPLNGKVKEGTRVRSVSRRRMVKTEMPGHPLRHDRPFQVLVDDANGDSSIVEADIVLDAGGVYSNPNWAGESGLPCPGEEKLNGRISRHLPDLLGSDRAEWIGKSIALVGDGHSAATAMMWLGDLHKEDAATTVHWVVPTDRSRPVVEVASDPLAERKRTVELSNELGQQPPSSWKIYRKQSLLGIKPTENGKLKITIGRNNKTEQVDVDKILSLTGYRPDTSNVEELQVQVSPVTGGSAGLASSLMSITDCLAKINVPPEKLQSGEKGFYFIGHKSYGRLNTFLLRSGLEQLDQIFSQLN